MLNLCTVKMSIGDEMRLSLKHDGFERVRKNVKSSIPEVSDPSRRTFQNT